MPTNPQPANEHTEKTPLEDLRRSALEHYEKASSAIHEWLSTIPQAINEYYDRRIQSVVDEGVPTHLWLGRCANHGAVETSHRCAVYDGERDYEYIRADLAPASNQEACVKCGHLRDDPKRRGSDEYNSFCVRGCGCDCVFAAATPNQEDEEVARGIVDACSSKNTSPILINDVALVDFIAADRARVRRDERQKVLAELNSCEGMSDVFSAEYAALGDDEKSDD